MENKNKITGAWIGGIFVGIALCVAFWAGHSYWPADSESVPVALGTSKNGVPTASAPPQTSTKFLTIAENTIADIAKQVSDSVVNIDIDRNITVAETPFSEAFPFRGFDFFVPGGRPKMQEHGSGSGVIFRSDGYILTNNHVVGNADQIIVRLNDKRQFKGTVVGKDSFTDLALVKIDAKDLPAARFGDSKTIRVGDWAIAIGSPLSLDHTVTLGIISALSRSIDELKNNVEFIQTDAAINPGNSGGPLLNIRGEVIGINTAIRGDGQNIGFAIPINLARDVAEQLLSNGKIDRPYLGVYMQELDEKLSKSLAVPQNIKGVVVAGLQPDGPAEKASIAQGDILQKVDGKPVETPKEVQQIVRSHKPGDAIPFIIFRDGKALSITVKVGTYPSQDARQ